jgi:hypothetical protein
MDYYKQRQRDNEEMAPYLFWCVVLFAILACIWAMVEIYKFLSAV